MNLKKNAHIYFMGICGTAMSSLAFLLKEKGFRVSGSDKNVYPPISDQLDKYQIPYFQSFSKDNITDDIDLVIVGNVISKHFEEVSVMNEKKIPYMSLPQALSHFFIPDKKSIVVSGTHGKTTTCSLIYSILEELSEDFSCLMGGILKKQGISHKLSSNKEALFLIEGDEYDCAFFDKRPKFVHYKPFYTILSSIEFDHADIYLNLEEVKKAFKLLFENSHKDGIFIYHEDDENIKELMPYLKTENKVSFGSEKADYSFRDLRIKNDKSFFDVLYKGKFLMNIETELFGKFNLLNILSSIALFHQLKKDPLKIKEGIKKARGVKRRQELLGEFSGIKVMEDFAHHPSSVSYLLDSLREKYKDHRIFCVFEPRSASSRRKVFQDDYLKAFDQKADCSIIFKPFFQDKINKEDRFDSLELVKNLKERSNQAYYFDEINSLNDFLVEKTKKGDLIIFISNGGFYGVYQKLIQSLKKMK